MTIRKVSVSNFKSYRNLELELGNFTVLIGPNESGKSNFVEIFRFLRDVVNYGLENAISLQGGPEYFRNVQIGSSENFSLTIDYEKELTFQLTKDERVIQIMINEIEYELSIGFNEEEFEISRDKLTLACELFELEPSKEGREEIKNTGKGKIILSNDKGKINIIQDLPESILPDYVLETLPPRTLLVETTPLFLVPPFEKLFGDIPVYSFYSKPQRESASLRGKIELEEDGSNLAIVLRNILKDENKRRKFLNLVKDVLPFVEGLNVERILDNSLDLKIQETYAPRVLPFSALSRGTKSIIAFIVALYFEEKSLIIFEEPVAFMHPSLISRVMDMFREASRKKQIIITTHSPEVVKHADLDDVVLISRDKEGFSIISRPGESKGVKTFLENEIGIDDLYVQNLLEV